MHHKDPRCAASDQYKPGFSVVVCTRDRTELLERCLEGLRNLCYPNFEIVIVENGASNPKTRHLAKQYQARYLCQPEPGVSKCRNDGARSSSSEIIAFIDDDAIPDKQWLCALAQEFSASDVMAVTGLIQPTNSDAYGGTDQYVRHRGRRRRFDSKTPEWFGLTNFGGIGDASNMAFRRIAFEIWPGFNERLGLGTAVPGCADHNAFFELIKRGHQIVFTPSAIVHHPFPETREKARRRLLRYLEATFAYVAYLFVEEPRHRLQLISFVARAALRRIVGVKRDGVITLKDELKSSLAGLNHYIAHRKQRRDSLAPSRFTSAKEVGSLDSR
jgi:glycosyltransferase involved in cell wall biosynthesis